MTSHPIIVRNAISCLYNDLIEDEKEYVNLEECGITEEEFENKYDGNVDNIPIHKLNESHYKCLRILNAYIHNEQYEEYVSDDEDEEEEEEEKEEVLIIGLQSSIEILDKINKKTYLKNFKKLRGDKMENLKKIVEEFNNYQKSKPNEKWFKILQSNQEKYIENKDIKTLFYQHINIDKNIRRKMRSLNKKILREE